MNKTKTVQNLKKRPALSQDGPAAKKPNIQHGKNNERKQSNQKPLVLARKDSNETQDEQDGKGGDLKKKKRALPMTNEKDASDTDEDSANELRDTDDEATEENEMEIDGRQDPHANHESHVAQRALLASRRAVKPHATLLAEAKRIWAQAHQKHRERRKEGTGSSSSGNTERRAHVVQLMNLVRGHVQELVLKHDACRIIQTIVKYGTVAERLEVAKELDGHYLRLIQGKYSKFLVSKLIRYSPAVRSLILPQLVHEVPRLLHHAYASPVLADAYALHCTGPERMQLLRGFWGREAALFGDGISGGEGKVPRKNENVESPVVMHNINANMTTPPVPLECGLKGVLAASSDMDRRKRTLAAVRDILLGIFNNPSPVATRHAITHRALWEYLEAVGSTELFDGDSLSDQDRERAWREVYESCQEVLAEMVHTREGSRSVREFIARGTAKDRKQIIKVLKPYLARMAQDDEAQLVLFTALDVVDDTKLTAKQLVGELLPDPPTPALPADLLKTTAGRRTLVYLLVPRSPRHFTPALVSMLAATDSLRAITSKKDPTLRANEVKRAASLSLLALVADHGVSLSRDPKGSLVVAEIMLFAEGDKSAAQNTLLGPLATPYPTPEDTDPHPIDLPHTSRLYKTLLQGGHYDRATRTFARTETWDAGAFATEFARVAGRTSVLAMACGRGTFVVAELCARLCVEGDAEMRKDVHAWFAEDVRAEVGRSSAKGRDTLLEKLKELDTALSVS